jgi:AraC-like DNA-binding protein
LKHPVERVVAYLYDQYDQPISLADMADVAILSQFHFARTFREVTGVSPGRFLSAIRLHRAKGLLVGTSLTVTDISYMVGYNSLGTFTSRFSKSVGLTPLQFRRLAEADLGQAGYGLGHPVAGGSLSGWISVPDDMPELRVYLGVFDSPIVQRMPVACAVLDGKVGHDAFELTGVPEGEWYLLAAAVDVRDSPVNEHGSRVARLVAREGPVKIISGRETILALQMRAARSTDPPMLLAVPGLHGCGAHSVVTVA